MRFYTQIHKHVAGVDLHGKNLYLCLIDSENRIRVHRRIANDPERFLRLLEPFRDDLVVAVESTFNWYWLGDLCRDHGINFLLGHALELRLIHGAKTGNDRLDSERLARLVRAGSFPQAYPYAKEWRSARDLLRRRTFIVRRRANLLTHIQNTGHQHLVSLPGKLPKGPERREILGLFDDPGVRLNLAADLELLEAYDPLIEQLETEVLCMARHHDRVAFELLRTVPGIGRILAMTMLYEIREIARFPTVQQFLSYSRLVTPLKLSSGKVKGSGARRAGNKHLRWAFGEAAALFVRSDAKGKVLRDRLASRHGKPKALAIIAARIARAVYQMLKTRTAFDPRRFHAGTSGKETAQNAN